MVRSYAEWCYGECCGSLERGALNTKRYYKNPKYHLEISTTSAIKHLTVVIKSVVMLGSAIHFNPCLIFETKPIQVEPLKE